MTLARFKNGVPASIGQFLERNNDLQAGPMWVDHFTLFRSHLGGQGAHYESLCDYFLTPPNASAKGRRHDSPSWSGAPGVSFRFLRAGATQTSTRARRPGPCF